MKTFNIYYNDGVYYGTMKFDTTDERAIEMAIEEEIESNNKNPNKMYHITRDNFKLVEKNTFAQMLKDYIKDNSGVWDLTDVEEFLLYNKDEIIHILQNLNNELEIK